MGESTGVGIGSTTTAFGSVTIGAAGTITGIAITNPGYGYTTSVLYKFLFLLPQ